MDSQLLTDAQVCTLAGPERAPGLPPWVILGRTAEGRSFRPSDWAQRLAAASTINCDYCGQTHQLRFNPLVSVIQHEDIVGLRVSPSLAERDTPLYEFIMGFAAQNGLVVRRG